MYYGIYTCQQNTNNSPSTFQSLLDETCRERKVIKGTVNRSFREPVWDWLVVNLSNAYAPKEAHEVDTIEGVKSITSNCSYIFTTHFSGTSSCNVCNGSNVSQPKPSLCNLHVSLPKFLVTEIALIDGKN